MIKSEPSIAEVEIKEEIDIMGNMIETTLVTVLDAKKVAAAAGKVLMKCEELRKSRDNWHQKYDELENKKKGATPLY